MECLHYTPDKNKTENYTSDNHRLLIKYQLRTRSAWKQQQYTMIRIQTFTHNFYAIMQRPYDLYTNMTAKTPPSYSPKEKQTEL